MSASSSLNKDIFTRKFFTIDSAEEEPDQVLFKLLPSADPEKLKEFIDSPQGKAFKEKVFEIIASLKAWAKSKNIAYHELDDLWRINFADYSGSKLERNYDLMVLYRDGVIALNKILKILNSLKPQDIMLEQRCENAMRNLVQPRTISLCEGGAYNQIISALAEMRSSAEAELMNIRMQIAKDVVLDKIVQINRKHPNYYPAGTPTHYAVYILNHYSQALGIPIINDPNITSVVKEHKAKYLENHFYVEFSRALTLENVVNQIINNINLNGLFERISKKTAINYGKFKQLIKLRKKNPLNLKQIEKLYSSEIKLALRKTKLSLLNADKPLAEQLKTLNQEKKLQKILDWIEHFLRATPEEIEILNNNLDRYSKEPDFFKTYAFFNPIVTPEGMVLYELASNSDFLLKRTLLQRLFNSGYLDNKLLQSIPLDDKNTFVHVQGQLLDFDYIETTQSQYQSIFTYFAIHYPNTKSFMNSLHTIGMDVGQFIKSNQVELCREMILVNNLEGLRNIIKEVPIDVNKMKIRQAENTLLTFAALQGHFEIVQFLIEKGAAVNQVAQNDVTALMCSAQQGHLEVVRFLIEKGATVNQKRKNDDKTALICAAANGYGNIVKELILAGATYDKHSIAKLSTDKVTRELLQIVNNIPDPDSIKNARFKSIQHLRACLKSFITSLYPLGKRKNKKKPKLLFRF